MDTGAAQAPGGASSHQQGLDLDSGGAYQDSGGAGADDASAYPGSTMDEAAQASGGAEALPQPPASAQESIPANKEPAVSASGRPRCNIGTH